VPVTGVSNAKEKAAKDKPAPNQSRLGNRARKPPSAARSLPVPDPERSDTGRRDAELPESEGLNPEHFDTERLDPVRPDSARGADGVADGPPGTELAASPTAEPEPPTAGPSLMAPGSSAIAGSPGPHPVEVAGLLHELSAELLSADDLPQAMDRLAAFVAAGVPSVMRCSSR
jgi:hypothetical protein